MKFNSLKDANEFLRLAQSCKGKVSLRTIYSDVFNLKSRLIGYVAASALLQHEADNIELDCEFPEDEKILKDFFQKMEQR